MTKAPRVIKPADHADYRADKMGKSTLFESERLLVGLNAFEPGQAHALHAHAGQDVGADEHDGLLNDQVERREVVEIDRRALQQRQPVEGVVGRSAKAVGARRQRGNQCRHDGQRSTDGHRQHRRNDQPTQ